MLGVFCFGFLAFITDVGLRGFLAACLDGGAGFGVLALGTGLGVLLFRWILDGGKVFCVCY